MATRTTKRECVEIQNQYNVVVKNRYENIQEIGSEDAEQQWNTLQKAIREANDIVLPEIERKAKKPWMTEEILNLMNERRKFISINNERYRILNRIIHKQCNIAKEK